MSASFKLAASPTEFKSLEAATVALVNTYSRGGEEVAKRAEVVYRASVIGTLSLSDLATNTARARARAAYPTANDMQVDAIVTSPDYRVSKSTLSILGRAYTLVLKSGLTPDALTIPAARTLYTQGGAAYKSGVAEFEHTITTAANAGTPFTPEQFVELAAVSLAASRAASAKPEGRGDGGEVEVADTQVAQSTRQSDTVAADATVTTPPSAEGVVFALEQIAEGDWSPEEAARILAALTATHATLSGLFAGLVSA